MNILIITFGYPSPEYPDNAPFVEQIVLGLLNTGANITVIQPVKKSLINHNKFPKISTIQYNQRTITILRPKYFSFSDKQIGDWNSYFLTLSNFTHAVTQAIKWVKEVPDVIYAHFFFPCGPAATNLGQKLGIPVFIGSGESYLEHMEPYFEKYSADLCNNCTIIAVSHQNKLILENQHGFKSENIFVLNNGVDLNLFYPRDRHEARSHWHLPQNKFIVGYVGSFTYKKGVLRLISALAGIEDVSIVLIGDGPLKPSSNQIVFMETLDHKQVPDLLSSVDIFVLPTMGEGCCNAILEAMACGLPIISSDREFNDDILTEQVALRVDPENIDAIRQAIIKLKINPSLRQFMSINSLKWVKDNFDIAKRSEKIYLLMQDRIINSYKKRH